MKKEDCINAKMRVTCHTCQKAHEFEFHEIKDVLISQAEKCCFVCNCPDCKSEMHFTWNELPITIQKMIESSK